MMLSRSPQSFQSHLLFPGAPGNNTSCSSPTGEATVPPSAAASSNNRPKRAMMRGRRVSSSTSPLEEQQAIREAPGAQSEQ